MKNSTNKKKNIVSKNDQLKVILEIMGKQTSEDTSFISDASAIDYVNNLNSNQQKIEFKKEFPYTTPGVLDILQDMLQFNPLFRSHPSELLKHEVFNSIRKPDIEKPAPFKIQLAMDVSGSFDYNECRSNSHTVDDYRKMLAEEINIIKQFKI